MVGYTAISWLIEHDFWKTIVNTILLLVSACMLDHLACYMYALDEAEKIISWDM